MVENISAWVLSIAGICIVSVVLELLLPEGKTQSYIKTIISYAIIFVIVMPLPKILNFSFVQEDIFTNDNIFVQEDYIYNLNNQKLAALKADIQNEIEKRGVLGVEVSISADIFTNPMEIQMVYIDIYNAVLSGDNKNIDIEKETKEAVIKFIDISKEKVIVYE